MVTHVDPPQPKPRAPRKPKAKLPLVEGGQSEVLPPATKKPRAKKQAAVATSGADTPKDGANAEGGEVAAGEDTPGPSSMTKPARKPKPAAGQGGRKSTAKGKKSPAGRYLNQARFRVCTMIHTWKEVLTIICHSYLFS